MKMLSWIRTIKQNRLDQPKKFKLGNFFCVRAQVSSEVQDIRTNSFAFYEPSHDHPKPQAAADEELRFDHEDGFSGFLTIGTLGIEPETPRFTSAAEEDVTGAQKDISKLITKKLDKILDKYDEDSSSKQVERSNAEGDRESHDVRPSQGIDLYLSPLEFTKRSKDVKKEKGFLTTLFIKRRKTVERECNSMEKHGTPYMIKRVFEKLHRSSSKAGNNDDVPNKKDLRKNVQIFRSKVHPVYCTPPRDDKEIDDSRRSCTNRCKLKDLFLSPESISEEANMKREKWIKTDAEYLVLEF